MAHFAQLDQNNVVKQIVVIRNEDILDENGVEKEAIGIHILKTLYGPNTVWKQTSYNNSIRSKYAEIGGTYSPEYDIFIARQPYPSWILNTQTHSWVPPIPAPVDGKPYIWNEATQSWSEISLG
jgi:hypothetical protein